MRRRTKVTGAVLGCTLVLSSCSSGGFGGAYDLPLPGGADLGEHPMHLTVQFSDVLDLVPQAAVKVADVPVGRVEQIELGADGWTPQTRLALNGDVVLPANARARLRQSSLLGEKFVELSAPDPAATGGPRLADGAVITADRSDRSPEFEEVFGALSLLLNGGGIGQLQTISRELTAATRGNEQQIRTFLGQVDTLVSDLDRHKLDITTAIDGLNRLSSTLDTRRDQVTGALNDLTPGLATLRDQRGQLVRMLQALDQLSTVGTDTIRRSKDDVVADLNALAPILRRLADSGQDLTKALEILPSFPFTDAVLGAIRGDYLNIYATIAPAPGVTLPPPGEGEPPDPSAPPVPLPITDGGS